MDQHGLVDRARQGDRQAFAELARASGARLDATARLILRDPELAQDAVQETLIRAWRSLPGLRDPATFDDWLHSLVANACIDLIRKRRRRVIEVELTELNDPPDARRHRARSPNATCSTAHWPGSIRKPARSSCCTSTSTSRSPEVAAMLGIPVGTAKSRLHRSLGDDAFGRRRSRTVTSAGTVTIGGPMA